MKKKFIFIAMLCIAAISAFVACDKKDKESVEEMTIFGTVLDAVDGTPVQNAQIELFKDYDSPEQQLADDGTYGTVGSAVTGSDGSYEFTVYNINKKIPYVLTAYKAGYRDSEMTISTSNTKNGGKVRCDFRLTPTSY